MNNYIILKECGAKTDFNNWNSIQNRYGSKKYSPRRPPPKKLVEAVIREFEQFCKNYHINSTAYKFIEPSELEGNWCQFDFIDDVSAKYPMKISCHSIVSNRNGKVLQRIFDFGQ